MPTLGPKPDHPHTPLIRPLPIRPASAGAAETKARAETGAAMERSSTAPGHTGDAPRPQGNPILPANGWARYPHYDAQAYGQYQSLAYLERHPDIGVANLWNNGTVPFFPTGERAPTAAESAALSDFAAQINRHRRENTGAGLPPTYLHRLDPLRNGEYGALYSQGPAGPVRQDFKYNEDESVALGCAPDTRMIIHSHPMRPLQGPATIDDLARRMPSVTDHQQASLDQMRSRADNYLIYGDRALHFDGRDLSVTELRPSPLEGRMPEVTP